MEYRDEASSSSASLHLNENGENGTIEFIKVEQDEETQFGDEIWVEKPFVEGGNDTLEGENDYLNKLLEATTSKEKFVFRLVDSIHGMPILWKQDSQNNRNPRAVTAAWNSLSEEFGMPVNHLKTKWKNLRNQFRRNYVNMKQIRATSDNDYQPTWFAFESMLFLEESNGGKVTETDETNASNDNSCVENESTQLELINQVRQTPVLWDKNWPLYHNRDDQILAWKLIAERMNLPADDLKCKWTKLKARLRDILYKLKSKSFVSLHVRRPCWFAFEAMQFVLPHMNTYGIDLDFKATHELNTTENENNHKDMFMEVAIAKEKFILRLVQSIRKLPILWKQDNRYNIDPSAATDAWNSLSEKFGIPMEVLKTKWKSLRDQFRRNYVNMKQIRATSDNDYQPTWFAFESMLFLEESNGGKVTETDETNPSTVVDDNCCEETESTQEDEMDEQSIILELINQVKQSPVLWDQNCPLYNNKDEQVLAWKNIAERINLPAANLKCKWTKLRTHYQKILRKVKLQLSADLPIRRSTWFAFEAMEFVLNNTNTAGVNLDFSTEVSQPKTVTSKSSLPKAVSIKRLVPTTVTSKQPVSTPISVKKYMADPPTVIQPLPKPVTIKRIVPKAVHLSSMTNLNIRDCKRRYTGSAMSTPPKVLRTSNSSLQSTSKPDQIIKPLCSTSSNTDPFITKTFQNLTENSPYSGLVNHLSAVLSKKRASDFNEIEGLLLNWLNELRKFPNAGNDSVHAPATNVIDDSDPNNDEREDSTDPYD